MHVRRQNPRLSIEFFRSEDGAFGSTVIFLAVIIAIMAVAIIDGSSVFYAFRSANQISEAAAESASEEYRFNNNDARARLTAQNYCTERGLDFIEVRRVPELSANSYSVTCSVQADTYVFKRLPYLRDLIHQEATNVSYKS